MRTTSTFTISLPPSLAIAADRLAESKHMTRSELHRSLLRNAIEEADYATAMADYKKAKKEGKMIELTGSLADLIKG